MKTVIALFWRDEDVRSSLDKLEEAGIARNSISTPRHIAPDRLAGDLGHPVVSYASWGAVIGVAIFGIFGLAAALAGCNCFGYDTTYGAATLVGFVAVGSLVGALLALWIGIDAQERETHLYVQGMKMGAKLVAVQSDAEQITVARAVLRDGNGVGVRILTGNE
jgi:hypothetical protein